jgi:hypothetical protein
MLSRPSNHSSTLPPSPAADLGSSYSSPCANSELQNCHHRLNCQAFRHPQRSQTHRLAAAAHNCRSPGPKSPRRVVALVAAERFRWVSGEDCELGGPVAGNGSVHHGEGVVAGLSSSRPRVGHWRSPVVVAAAAAVVDLAGELVHVSVGIGCSED